MKKTIILCVCIVTGLSAAMAQKAIVVQNGAKTKFYSTLEEAVTAAAAGDTLYIPGGTFAAPSTIGKTLHWVGLGHYPAGTSATSPSVVSGAINFTGNCDDSSMEGIYFQGNISLGSAGNDASGISIKRCRIGGELTLRADDTGNPDLSFEMTESVLEKKVDGKNSSGAYFAHNILVISEIANFTGSLFNFNAFPYYNSYGSPRLMSINNINNCNFINNAFSANISSTTVNGCTFKYNLLGSEIQLNSSNSLSNNIINVGTDNVFVYMSRKSQFSYTNNYHLKTGSAGIGGASDGTNIGIYGSSMPYKTNAVPFYPHVSNMEVNTEANATNNTLGVKITVKGQSR